MKKYMNYLCGFCLLCVLCASCAKDDDSNPTLNTENLTMTLLESTYPTGTLLDLSKSETINLKLKEQPNYGYPAIAVYSVQVSIDPAFLTVAPSDAKPNLRYITLATNYTKANMNVDAMEMNNAIIKMYQAENNGNDPTGLVMDAYVRVCAQVSAQGGKLIPGTECYSNVIKLSNLTVAYVAAIPKTIFLSGSSVKGGSGAKKWAPVYGVPGTFYTIAYFGAGDTFLWGDSEDTGIGCSRTSTYDDQAGAGLGEASDGSFQVANAGWYVLQMTTAVDKAKNALISDLTIYPGHAYIIGPITGKNDKGEDKWEDSDPACELVAPATADGIWESPAFVGDGELRAYIKVPPLEWWHTEFTLLKGNIFWRTVDIPANWNDNVGEAYSVKCTAGQKLYINFDDLTGEVK